MTGEARNWRRTARRRTVVGLAALAAWGCVVLSVALSVEAGPPRKAAWTTSRVVGTPDPPPPYIAAAGYNGLQFYEPLEACRVPDGKHLAVAERPGKVFVFVDRQDVAERTLLIDLRGSIYGLAFHPRFQENGWFFVTAEVVEDERARMAVLRFQCDPQTFQLDADSRLEFLHWESEGHRGGCLRFGPDGHLYIAVGDGSGIADQKETGQRIDDLLGAILRIDVNRKESGRPYAIPADNPFVERAGARGEVYSYGHRQVWKFSFDAEGRLWAGDIGQDLWEMIYLVKKGGNYGWSVQEGSHPFRPDRTRGPTPIEPPIVEHSHNDFRSITGGYLYQGSRLSDIAGHYVYADYDTGRVWAFKYERGRVTRHRELADTPLRTVAILENHSNELFFVDFAGGRLHRLMAAPRESAPADFPRRLSETGLFVETRSQQPAPGLLPYEVNAELWSDGAIKDRWIALPGASQIGFDEVPYPQPAPGADPGWKFPDGTVLVKTFSIELEAGNPESRRRLETRLLHLKRMPGTDEYGTQYWRGYTYLWNDAQTDAELLDAAGLDRALTVRDPAAPNGERRQVWRFPSRAECTLCHTMSAKYALGVNTLQLNRTVVRDGAEVNQLQWLAEQGAFTADLPRSPERLPRLADDRDPDEDLHLRARAYLHANCAHCHRKWGGGNGEFQLLAGLKLRDMGLLEVAPEHGRFELSDPKLLVPGHPDRSLILYRLRKLGLGRMPHVSSNQIDAGAAELLEKWIQSLGVGDADRTGFIEGAGP